MFPGPLGGSLAGKALASGIWALETIGWRAVANLSGADRSIRLSTEDFEVAEGMIPGALHIPMGQLQARLSELDPAVPVIVVCRSGNRSLDAGHALEQAGFTVVGSWTDRDGRVPDADVVR